MKTRRMRKHPTKRGGNAVAFAIMGAVLAGIVGVGVLGEMWTPLTQEEIDKRNMRSESRDALNEDTPKRARTLVKKKQTIK